MNVSNLAHFLRAFTDRRRFRPFLIELNSGDRILVSHPEAISLAGDRLHFQGPDRLFDSDSVCQVLDEMPRGS